VPVFIYHKNLFNCTGLERFTGQLLATNGLTNIKELPEKLSNLENCKSRSVKAKETCTRYSSSCSVTTPPVKKEIKQPKYISSVSFQARCNLEV